MSEIARSGFIAEDQVVGEFQNWGKSKIAKQWLTSMEFTNIKSVSAKTTRSIGDNSKSDVLVTVNSFRTVGISVKKFTASYNQIDKRWVDDYQKLWDIPHDVVIILKKYCGAEGYRPIDANMSQQVRDDRRYFLTEMKEIERQKILNFFNKNKSRITRDVFAGNSGYQADYILAIKKNDEKIIRSNIIDIKVAINHYGGTAKITKLGNLRLGRITIQRKGGDCGKRTAQMLQFKFSPKDIFDL